MVDTFFRASLTEAVSDFGGFGGGAFLAGAFFAGALSASGCSHTAAAFTWRPSALARSASALVGTLTIFTGFLAIVFFGGGDFLAAAFGAALAAGLGAALGAALGAGFGGDFLAAALGGGFAARRGGVRIQPVNKSV